MTARTSARRADAGKGVLSPRPHDAPDSHSRHRPGAPPHRLGSGGERRQSARLRRLRLSDDGRRRKPRRAAVGDPRRAHARRRGLSPRRGGGRSDLRQQGRRRHAQARPGARGCHGGAGQGGDTGLRICAKPGEEEHRRRRPRRQGAGSHDDRRPASAGRTVLARRRRRARRRGDTRASSAERCSAGGNAMIGKLTGVIDSYGEDSVILDVGGVGYLVHCSARTLQELPRPGEPARLAIETHVREDQIRLFGFVTETEREWFRLLQTVQGVGTKVALSVLGTLKPADLAAAIAMRDKATVARAPGVGAKVAERIVTELKDKAPVYADVDPAVVRLSGALDEKRAPQPIGDAVSALVNLGYGQPQAAAAIAAAVRSAGEGAEVRTLIRLGLKELAR